MLNTSEIITIVKKQLAVDFNCQLEDFDKTENIITFPGLNEERRKFSNKPSVFKMLTLGRNAIISADLLLHEWLSVFNKDRSGHWLFEYQNLCEIEKKLKPLKTKLYHISHMFLPIGQCKQIETSMQIKWYEQEEIHQFYVGGKFPNALCKEFDPGRPDMIAVAAFENDEIIGMAGCSADSPVMWQIGIDVDEKHQGKGVGTGLVSLLKNEISNRGKIPYYGTSSSNIHSWKIALNCGFSPVWIEAYSKD